LVVQSSCFDRLFKSVNADLKKFEHKRRSLRLVNNEDLVGIEYLWELILNGSEDVAHRGIQLIKEIYTNLSPPSKQEGKRIHESFIADCYQRLKQVYEKLQSTENSSEAKLNMLIRILIVLHVYLAECDYAFHKERAFLPMARSVRVTGVFHHDVSSLLEPFEVDRW
jgi:ubiquitin carboxyl-terminal hydrolase 9/24